MTQMPPDAIVLRREQLDALFEALDHSVPRFSIRIEAPHFVAAVDIEAGIVVQSAPILRYMQGWHCTRVLTYAKRKGWQPAIL